jgi:hypothetical protein
VVCSLLVEGAAGVGGVLTARRKRYKYSVVGCVFHLSAGRTVGDSLTVPHRIQGLS